MYTLLLKTGAQACMSGVEYKFLNREGPNHGLTFRQNLTLPNQNATLLRPGEYVASRPSTISHTSGTFILAISYCTENTYQNTANQISHAKLIATTIHALSINQKQSTRPGITPLDT